uniref:Uncharacterized protein n=1 Tax=Magnetospirillum gryphiswaldense TaxID=55518 RepID=A4TTP9_9PROT|nr:hypothetical protein MGR_2086 [Magnetospirillum gryphiswaldense MSR-1]
MASGASRLSRPALAADGRSGGRHHLHQSGSTGAGSGIGVER